MRFGREIDRLLFGLLLAFVFVGAAAAYWAISGADTILERADNPRRVETENAIRRGAIYAEGGIALAESVVNPDESVTRRYLYPVLSSALGYASLRYGVGGVEALHDNDLSGRTRAAARDLGETVIDGLLHRPQVGADVQLTLDLGVQTALATALHGQTGAAVVLGVPTSSLMAMVSLPTFDPNTLDADWDALSIDPGRPFFNRALQARYQPGATTETLLMAGALLTNEPLDTPIADASSPISLDDLTLTCAVPPPETRLTLRDAYAFGCPAPFADLARRLDVGRVQGIFDTFRLADAATLPGFDALTLPTVLGIDPFAAATPEAQPNSDGAITADNLLNAALGQGERTVTPLEMALIAAGIVNDGNAPQPYLLSGVRYPTELEWSAAALINPTIPIATAGTARGIQDLMRGAVAYGAASSAARPDLDIGGHVGLAYTGDSTLAWFVGFVTIDTERAAVVAVVLENSGDLGLAADIGGTALEAAWRALQS
ncbi:MAG: penicillin-binding transpeptidase domain-containing protein [Chloroflexota bacterium]|nr:penicillin-binding transpeptidase domain-containing protein [Chloroflexota bacterium]